MNKISIIIPVYNCEKFLNKCVDSVLNQTYKNFELILVDDGSKDSSSQICDDYAKKDSRVKVVHKINGGSADARNKGIEVSTGSYIGFIDSDDYIDDTMYEKLLNKATEEDSDITMCRFKNIYENGTMKFFKEVNFENVNAENILSYYLESGFKESKDCVYANGIMGNVWRTLIKKDFIGDIRFQKLLVAEDLLFLISLIKKDTKISIVNEYLYNYLQRTGSIMNSFNKNKIIQRYDAFKIILNKVKGKLSEDNINSYKFYNYASIVNELLKNNQKELLNDLMNDEFFRNLNSKDNYKQEQRKTTGFKRKFGYFLVHKKWFNLYSLLIRH